MFFYLSKVLDFLLMPYTWIIACVLGALFFKKDKWKRKSLIASVFFIFFFGNSFIIDEFIRNWEVPATKLDVNEKYDAAIILSGMLSYDETLDRINFNSSVDRLLQALLIQQNGNVKKVIFSGGSGDINHPHHKESIFIKKFLKEISYPTENFIFESQSRNTHENADSSIAILKKTFPGKQLDEKVLLVTSASHMKRSLACFKKSGLTCIPYSTNRLSGPRKFELGHMLIPNSGAINYWNHYLHEVLGYCIYKVMGFV